MKILDEMKKLSGDDDLLEEKVAQFVVANPQGLIQALEECADPRLLERILDALGWRDEPFEDDRILAAVGKFVHHPDSEVRYYAHQYLGFSGNPTYFPQLSCFILEESPFHVDNGWICLSWLKNFSEQVDAEMVSFLRKVLEFPDQNAQWCGIQALRDRRTRKADALLAEFRKKCADDETCELIDKILATPYAERPEGEDDY